MTYYDKHIMSTKEWKRHTAEYDKVKYKCSCGHRVVIPYWRDKGLCSWCHNYVYKDKQTEFKERLKERLKVQLEEEKALKEKEKLENELHKHR